MYRLYFENSNGVLRILGDYKTIEECLAHMRQFLEEHNFTSYYTRTIRCPDGKIMLDVGSWSEFFYIEVLENEDNEN